MKKLILSALLAMMSMSVYAFDGYSSNGVIFPDETSVNGLPYAIPCTEDDYTGAMSCVWLQWPRHVTIYNKARSEDTVYVNQFEGRCINGVCRIPQGQVGTWNKDIEFRLSIWYYIATSTDGKPVAYRLDGGPQNKGLEVSYVEAGRMLLEFYKNAGVPEKLIANTFSPRYEGGYRQYLKDFEAYHAEKVEQVERLSKVNSAWCNPRADDDCTVNDHKVLKKDLGKYFPHVSPEEVSKRGGYCEYPICYDANDKPIGIR